MKIFAYGIRLDEQPVLEQWGKEHSEVTVDFTDQLLTDKSAAMAKGYDAINVYQQLPYSRATFEALSNQGIHIMAMRNIGIDNLDLKAAKEFNFKISNTPAYSPNSVAEHAAIQMARLFRRTPEMDAKVQNYDLRWAPTIGKEMRQQTIGIIGTGRIGRVLIKILQGFGSKVIAYDCYHNSEIEKEGLYVDSLDNLYRLSDGISLHVPAVSKNFHMINDASIAKMKDHVIIVNDSRGELVDTDALIKGLDSGKISAFATDVYEKEVGIFNKDWSNKTFPDSRLKNLIDRPNVLLTPHTAFYTETAVSAMVNESLNADLSFLNGKQPASALKF